MHIRDVDKPRGKGFAVRIGVGAVAALMLMTGCGTTGGSLVPKRAPVDVASVRQDADAVLDYIHGKRAALPDSMIQDQPVTADDGDVLQKMQEVALQMRDRAAELAPLKASGILGEDNRGYLSLRNDEDMNNDQKNNVQQLMSGENADRKAFYRTVAHADEESGLTLTRVERVFAERRRARSEGGTTIQLPPDGDEFEKLKASQQGIALGDACRPGAWVKIP